MIENPFVIAQRKRYLKTIRKYRQEGRNIVFLDESYINAHHCPSRVLSDTSIKSASDAAEKGLTTGYYFHIFDVW